MQATGERRQPCPCCPLTADLDPPRNRLQVGPGIPAQLRPKKRAMHAEYGRARLRQPWDGEPPDGDSMSHWHRHRPCPLGVGACAGAAVVGSLVLDDMSADDDADLDGVGAGIGVDRAARLERA